MSDTPHLLAFQRYQALTQLNQHHQDQWQTLNEMHSIECKLFEDSLTQKYDISIALFENHLAILQASVEKIEDPAVIRTISVEEQLDYWKTEIEDSQESLNDLRDDKRACIETLGAKQQNELDDLCAKHVTQSLEIENSSAPLDDVESFVGTQEQAELDISRADATSPFGNLVKYNDLAQNDFNQASNPFTQEQSTDMER